MKTKFTVTLLAIGMLISMVIGSAKVFARPADCLFIVNSEIIFQGTCEFTPVDRAGSFQILRGPVFAYLFIEKPGIAIGSWTGPRGSGHAHNPLGQLKRDYRDPACWANDKARVCAR